MWPIFRRIRRVGEVGEPLTASAERDILTVWLAMTGQNKEFSARSLRSGFVTKAAHQKVSIPVAMAMTGHNTASSVMGQFHTEACWLLAPRERSGAPGLFPSKNQLAKMRSEYAMSMNNTAPIKKGLRMKTKFLAVFCGLCFFATTGSSMAQSSHAPTKEDLKRISDQMEQKHGQADHAATTEANRPKSQNEMFTNSIPRSTEVRPIYKDGGGGVKVTAPLGGGTVQR